MSDAPVYWSQPNQQVVRNGEPVGIVDEGPDPEAAETATKSKKRSTKDDD
jgi:hypothetical protein